MHHRASPDGWLDLDRLDVPILGERDLHQRFPPEVLPLGRNGLGLGRHHEIRRTELLGQPPLARVRPLDRRRHISGIALGRARIHPPDDRLDLILGQPQVVLQRLDANISIVLIRRHLPARHLRLNARSPTTAHPDRSTATSARSSPVGGTPGSSAEGLGATSLENVSWRSPSSWASARSGKDARAIAATTTAPHKTDPRPIHRHEYFSCCSAPCGCVRRSYRDRTCRSAWRARRQSTGSYLPHHRPSERPTQHQSLGRCVRRPLAACAEAPDDPWDWRVVFPRMACHAPGGTSRQGGPPRYLERPVTFAKRSGVW